MLVPYRVSQSETRTQHYDMCSMPTGGGDMGCQGRVLGVIRKPLWVLPGFAPIWPCAVLEVGTRVVKL